MLDRLGIRPIPRRLPVMDEHAFHHAVLQRAFPFHPAFLLADRFGFERRHVAVRLRAVFGLREAVLVARARMERAVREREDVFLLVRSLTLFASFADEHLAVE